MTRRIPLNRLLPLYFAVATAASFADYHTRLYPDLGFTKYIPEVLSGVAEPPGRYRILAPYLQSWLADALPFAPVTEWLIFRWLCLAASIWALHVYISTWFDDAKAVLGVALVMALLPLTFTNSWPNPDHFTDLALFTVACACIARGWFLGFLVAFVANAFNRETSAFLVLLYLVSVPVTRTHLVQTATVALLWLGIAVGIRYELGFVPYNPIQFWQNLGWLTPLPPGYGGYKRVFGWFFIVLLLPMFLLATRDLKTQPRFWRHATGIVAPLYLAVGCVFSSTIESRIFTPMIPLLLPSMLGAIVGRPDSSDTSLKADLR